MTGRRLALIAAVGSLLWLTIAWAMSFPMGRAVFFLLATVFVTVLVVHAWLESSYGEQREKWVDDYRSQRKRADAAEWEADRMYRWWTKAMTEAGYTAESGWVDVSTMADAEPQTIRADVRWVGRDGREWQPPQT